MFLKLPLTPAVHNNICIMSDNELTTAAIHFTSLKFQVCMLLVVFFFSIRHHTSWDILFISWPQQNSIANSFSAKTPATQHGLKKITRKANVQEFWRTDERKVFCVINKARHGRVENIKYCPLSDSFSCATFMFLQSCQIFSNPSNMIVHFPYLY